MSGGGMGMELFALSLDMGIIYPAVPGLASIPHHNTITVPSTPVTPIAARTLRPPRFQSGASLKKGTTLE